MRLICPSCGAQYEVDESVIPESGRDVQCSNCGHAWFQASAAQLRARETAPPATAEPVAEPEADDTPQDAAEAPDEVTVAADDAATQPSDEQAGESAEEPDVVEEHAADADDSAGDDVPEVEDNAPEPEETVEETGQGSDDTVEAVDHETDTTDVETETEATETVDEAEPEEIDDGATTDEDVAAEVEETAADDWSSDDDDDDEQEDFAAAESVEASGPRRRGLDDAVRGVLREEAEREARARVAEGSALEGQPDLGLADAAGAAVAAIVSEDAAQDRVVRVRGNEDDLDEALVSPASRRELLPDIEEINSTLRATSERGGDAASFDAPETVTHQRRSGFRRGFSFTILIAALALLIYVLAPLISESFPALEPALTSYASAVDTARVWLDGQMRSLTAAIQGTPGDG